MLASVITVCYNSEATIRKTIESVLCQTYDNIEYLIIDGLSKDNTVKIAEEYIERFGNRGYAYRIVSEKDNGIYDAMNKGIRLASGDLIGIINSDDWYETIAVETAVNEYEKDKFDLFYADINLIKFNGNIIVKHSKHDRFPTSRHWNHPTTFVTKETYNDIGLFKSVGIHDDFDFLLRAKKSNKKITIKNVVLANFKVGGVSNDRSLKKCKKRCMDRYRCYRDNGFNRLYFIECFCIELAKWFIG